MLAVLLVAATVTCGFAVWALVEVSRTSRSVRSLTDESRERLVPLLDKADVTVDAINAELLRIDAIITQVEQASERVSHASDTISGIVNTPAEIVNDVATRVRRAWKDRQRGAEEAAEERRWAQEHPADGEHGAPVEPASADGRGEDAAPDFEPDVPGTVPADPIDAAGSEIQEPNADESTPSSASR